MVDKKMGSFDKKKGSTQLKTLFLVITLICSGGIVESLKLDDNGYYDIVIAISEKTAQNANEQYLKNLKNGVQDLSNALFESTKGSFSIRSADIILPNHWNIDADALATTQNYQNADIRISHEFLVPQTLNPVFCGYAGRYIELPYSFFDQLDTGPYGPTGKALLELWGRFRWGVHVEHGFHGDPQFPYFWKNYRLPNETEDVPENWKVTNCANTEIKGQLLNHDGEACGTDAFDPDDIYPPSNDCRFFPEKENQTARSSLMSYPFIKSLTRFCDETTHDKRAPTRQNFYCRFHSVWEVINATIDWKTLKEDSKNVRVPIVYRILKRSVRKPLLYILSDGVNKPPDAVISGVSSGLDNIFSQTALWDVVAGAGSYPAIATEGPNRTNLFDHNYSWDLPYYDKSQLISAFETGFESKTGFRNFAGAIRDIVKEIKEMKHEAGAIILVIKYGTANENNFPTFENEVLGTILEENIRLFSLEGMDDKVKALQLKRISELTGGMNFQVGAGDDDEATVASVMSKIEELLKNGTIPQSRYRLAYKQTIQMESTESGKAYSIPVDYSNIRKFSVYFVPTITSGMTADSVRMTKGPNDAISLPAFVREMSWGKSDSPLYIAESEELVEEQGDWEFTFTCRTTCYALMVAIVELNDNADGTPLGGNIEITSVFTSVEEEKIADLFQETALSLKGTLFSIYAKVEKDGHSIYSPDLEVQAHLIYYADTASVRKTFTVNLVDNGIGMPDMTEKDGIFSGYFIPMAWPSGDTGTWEIFVTAKHRPKLESRRTKRSSETLLPIPEDQVLIGCGSGYQGCWSELITEPFVRCANAKRHLAFKGSSTYYNTQNAPTRILDLRVYPLNNGEENAYQIAWTEPVILIDGIEVQPAKYEVYYSESFDDIFGFITDIPQVTDVPSPINSRETRTVDMKIEQGSKFFFVMRSFEEKKPGNVTLPEPVLSNVVFLYANTTYEATTTAATTRFTPPDTSATTRLSTSDPITTTVPSLTSTTPATSTQQSTTGSTTTRRAITTVSSTQRSTTQKFVATTENPQKDWYQTTPAIVTFSVFSVAMVALCAGAALYARHTNQ